MEHVSLARFAYGRHFENEIPLLINRGREMSPISGNDDVFAYPKTKGIAKV